MADLSDKICPYFQATCSLEKCAWFDERLQNCAVHVMNYNMYKLENALRKRPLEPKPLHPKPFPPKRDS
jgi:hypothetical protein